jgi:two-component system LytT family response regulator
MSGEAGHSTVFTAVIVDDEPAAREAVRTFLSSVSSVEVVGEATNGAEALATVREVAPDLLFLDIQMPDQNGFAVLEELGDAVPRGVILVTAHGEYAQRAFEVHAVDYVTKPFGKPRFMAAVDRALHRLAAEEALDMSTTLRSLVESVRLDERGGADAAEAAVTGPASRAPARIGVRLGSRTTLVDIADIDWIEADGDLVRLHVGDRVHLLQTRMRDLERMFGTGFGRIHRSIIVNLDRVRFLHREPDGSGSVGLSTGVQLRVARGRWEELEKTLGLGRNG